MSPETGVFQDVIQDSVRYFARISKVYIKDFRGIMPRFSELFGGFFLELGFLEIFIGYS